MDERKYSWDDDRVTEATSLEDLRAIVREIGESPDPVFAHRLEDALRSRILVLIAMSGDDIFEGGPKTLEEVKKLARIALLTDRFPFHRGCA